MVGRWHLPRFNKVCFCFPLRTGNIVLVYVNLVLSLVECSACLFMEIIKLFIRQYDHSDDYNRLHRMIRFKNIPFAAAILVFAYGLAEIGMTIVVLIGWHKHRHRYILVYMYYTIFTSIMMVLSRIFDMVNELWYIEVGPVIFFCVFKAYYVLSIRSEINITKLPDLCTDEVDLSRDIELKFCGDEINVTDLNAQNVNNIEKILNDQTLDSDYESSEFGSADALVR